MDVNKILWNPRNKVNKVLSRVGRVLKQLKYALGSHFFVLSFSHLPGIFVENYRFRETQFPNYSPFRHKIYDCPSTLTSVRVSGFDEKLKKKTSQSYYYDLQKPQLEKYFERTIIFCYLVSLQDKNFNCKKHFFFFSFFLTARHTFEKNVHSVGNWNITSKN